jgi:hypothetical protein
VGRATTPQKRRPSSSSVRAFGNESAGAARGRWAREALGADSNDDGRFVALARVDARGAGMATACEGGESAPTVRIIEKAFAIRGAKDETRREDDSNVLEIA